MKDKKKEEVLNISSANFKVVPKYYQIKEFIKEKILKEYNVGAKIPGERELAKMFKTNHATVNKAISLLVQEGYLYREQGRGTFVANLKVKPKQGRVKIIGVIVPAIDSGIYPKLLKGIYDGADEFGYNVLLCNDKNSFEKQYFYVRSLLKYDVDGVILVPVQKSRTTSGNIKALKKLIKHKVKVVLVDRYIKEIETDYVISDNFQATYKLTNYLIKLGHRRIGFIREAITTTVEERVEGYKKALIDNKIKVDPRLIVGSGRINGRIGYVYTKKLLSLSNPPTAIMCINDLVAAGAIKALSEEGIKVPDQISITGFDDLDFAKNLVPPLTTVKQPIYEMGKEAIKLLMHKITNPEDNKIYKIILKSEPVIRDSCKKLF